MDTTAGQIEFDEGGICNFCREFELELRQQTDAEGTEPTKNIDRFIDQVKRSGGSKYDCIVGLSGGADSSWALYQARRRGLRPLAVHMDNGWNTELAQNNIENLVRKLDVDLYTHVIDWEEYRSLQQAFFDSDVIDIELLYDNALAGVNYRQARKAGVKYILSGSNTATEGLRMPEDWSCGNKLNKRNIRGIWKRFGRGGFPKTFPAYGIWDYLIDHAMLGITWIPFLDYFEYNKDDAVEVLQRDVSYRPYEYKHYESVFTRFYQGFLLPEKFGVDKRKNHLSALIMTGQMEREAALHLLASPPYSNPELLREDRDYFLSKMGWSEQELSEYLARPQVPHAAYGTDENLWRMLENLAQKRKRRRNGSRSVETENPSTG